MATTTTLLSLPTEILHEITSNLTYAPHLALSYTCHELRARLRVPNFRGGKIKPLFCGKIRAYNEQDLLKIERWPEFSPLYTSDSWVLMADRKEFFACFSCLKILPAIKFDHVNLVERFQKHGPATMGQRSLRKCIQCKVLRETDFMSGTIFCWTSRVTTPVVPAREATGRNNSTPYYKDGENSKLILTWGITNLSSQLLSNSDPTSQTARSPSPDSE
jgi:hypothetical protein